MNHFSLPSEKLACLESAINVIINSSNSDESLHSTDLSSPSKSSAIGADDFLPLFMYTVFHAHVPLLASSCEYMEKFLPQEYCNGHWAYYLTHLNSAIQFICKLSPNDLNITEEKFYFLKNQALNGII